MSNRIVFGMLAVGLLAAAPQGDPAKGDAAKAELDKLQGKWEVQSVEIAGKVQKDAKGNTLTFKGDKVEGLGADVTVKLMPAEKPKAIDLIRGSDKRPWMGVYQLDGDDLKLSMALVEVGKVDQQKRPTDFDAAKVQMILVLKRVKS
jgi:uncharacterized protein (TIGR03067 family)